MTTFKDVLDYVGTQATDAEVRALFSAGNARIKHTRALNAAANAATLAVGDEVELTGLKPKYLNGLRGTIDAKAGQSFEVKLDDDSRLLAGRYVRFNGLITVPASALKAV